MIKVGDKVHHQEKEWNVEFTGETFVHLKHGDDFIIESSHIFWNKLYAEQKQRADELEKRWSELVDVLKKKYEYYKVRADDESVGPIEQGKWRIAKHEMMMTLMAIAELQENDDA